MIQSDYYEDYRGPSLVKVTLNKKDITESIKEIYGEKNNWSGCLWTYKELFGSDSQGKHFKCDFKGVDGREHWFYGYIHDIHQYMNPPLATPMNQNI